jgi:hypothetical protein
MGRRRWGRGRGFCENRGSARHARFVVHVADCLEVARRADTRNRASSSAYWGGATSRQAEGKPNPQSQAWGTRPHCGACWVDSGRSGVGAGRALDRKLIRGRTLA